MKSICNIFFYIKNFDCNFCVLKGPFRMSEKIPETDSRNMTGTENRYGHFGVSSTIIKQAVLCNQ